MVIPKPENRHDKHAPNENCIRSAERIPLDDGIDTDLVKVHRSGRDTAFHEPCIRKFGRAVRLESELFLTHQRKSVDRIEVDAVNVVDPFTKLCERCVHFAERSDQPPGPCEDGVSEAGESPDDGRLPALRCGGFGLPGGIIYSLTSFDIKADHSVNLINMIVVIREEEHIHLFLQFSSDLISIIFGIGF